MPHLVYDQPFIHLITQQYACIRLTDLMCTAFRYADLFTCSVQPVVEPICTDPSALLIHEQELTEWIDRPDSFQCPFRCLWEENMPEGTVITVPYYTDLNVLVTLK